MALRYVELFVFGGAESARTTLEQALVKRKFRVAWIDHWSAVAQRAKVLGDIVTPAGQIGGPQKLAFGIRTAPTGEIVIHIEDQGGAVGWVNTGAWGHQKAMLASLCVELEREFSRLGTFSRTVDG